MLVVSNLLLGVLLLGIAGFILWYSKSRVLGMFALTLFVSAFLLFLVQPMIGKLILPKLGGTPQVWNTCMVFFQSALLAGYAYTHVVSARLTPRMQLMLHCGLLALPILFMLPIPFWYIGIWTPPPGGANPIWSTLGLLAFVVGVPFLIVSTSAPLLQRWFVYTGDESAKDPYFLYAASNMGSLLSLLAYPFIIEPAYPVVYQRYAFLIGYVVLCGLVLMCAATLWKMPALQTMAAGHGSEPIEAPEPTPAMVPEAQASTALKSGPAPGPAPAQVRPGQRKKGGIRLPNRPAETARPTVAERPMQSQEMTWGRRLRWVLLAMVPSSLMLGITSYISVDLSPFPLLWVIPLALYLLAFILVFLPWWTTPAPSPRGATGFTPHSLVMYVFMPLGILGLAAILLRGGFEPLFSTAVLLLSFFGVALGCHGELAKDRPPTRYLTEFYLMMSVGGMLGGVFNAIFAPLVFPGVWEFPIAIVLAAFSRPRLSEHGWVDNMILDSAPGFQAWTRDQGDALSQSAGRPGQGSTYLFAYIMDVVLALCVFGLALAVKHYATNIFELLGFRGQRGQSTVQMLYPVLVIGLPLLCCFFFSSRPLRMGLALMGVLLAQMYFLSDRGRGENLLYEGRSYFGVLKVYEQPERIEDPLEKEQFGDDIYKYTYLLHGTTYHGKNYLPAKDGADLSRLATTYYHRYGPVGIVMEQYNWLPGPQNTYWGDLRMPATQVGAVAAALGTSPLPVPTLVDLWSEPPYATVGLGTGTMASYARPYQHLAYYEIDEHIRSFSLPPPNDNLPHRPRGGSYFTYLQGAMKRGAQAEVIMGDARLSMNMELFSNAFNYTIEPEDPKDFTPKMGGLYPHREHYYKAMNVDAFSSDAIPVHLVTEEAIAMYLSKMTDDGVLCMHTSNRHLNLVRPIARIVTELEGYKSLVGKDADRGVGTGHFSSEYVMIYKKSNKKFEEYAKNVRDQKYMDRSHVEWYDPVRQGLADGALWTDDYSNLTSVIRWPWRRE